LTLPGSHDERDRWIFVTLRHVNRAGPDPVIRFRLPSITLFDMASKTDALVVDNDSQADSGDTLEYTVVVQNTGNQTATNETLL